jgi:hypothetical protein
MTEEQTREKLKERLMQWQAYVAQPRAASPLDIQDMPSPPGARSGSAHAYARRPAAAATAVADPPYTEAIVREVVRENLKTETLRRGGYSGNRRKGLSAYLMERRLRKMERQREYAVSPYVVVMGALTVAIGSALAVSFLLQ